MDRPEFVYPPVDGHMGHFHPLAIVNSAAMSICLQVFVNCLFSILLGTHPVAELLGSYGNSMVSTVAAYFALPSAVWVPIFLHPC